MRANDADNMYYQIMDRQSVAATALSARASLRANALADLAEILRAGPAGSNPQDGGISEPRVLHQKNGCEGIDPRKFPRGSIELLSRARGRSFRNGENGFSFEPRVPSALRKFATASIFRIGCRL
jgi:hypothetical protein